MKLPNTWVEELWLSTVYQILKDTRENAEDSYIINKNVMNVMKGETRSDSL